MIKSTFIALSLLGLFHDINAVQNAFSSIPAITNIAPLTEQVFEIKEGQTPGKVVIEKVVAYPAKEDEDEIILRNIGGQTVDLTGWRVTDNQMEGAYLFGEVGCQGNATIAPQNYLRLRPFSDYNPCGFKFGISFRDSVILYNEEYRVMANVTWEAAEQGTSLRRLGENRYAIIPETNANILDVLKATGKYNTFLKALEVTGLANSLKNQRNPEYVGTKVPSSPPAAYYDQIQFPWWFGFSVDRSTLSPPPPPSPPPPSPPVGIIPELGPYTVFAPSDEAFDQFRLQVGGNQAMIPFNVLFALPELKTLLQYHIMFGEYTSQHMSNSSGLTTALGPEVVVMKDASMMEGFIGVSDNCIDKPTPGFPCSQQFEFGKCYEPFMLSPLAAEWQGGFCQKTCGRCTCKDSHGGHCATIDTPDIIASNGVIQGISRVLFPPPIFEKVAAVEPEPEIEQAPVDILSSLPQNLSMLPNFLRLPN